MSVPLKYLIPPTLKAKLQWLKEYHFVVKLLGKMEILGSQAGQDQWVVYEAFNEKRNGYFIDVGAFDGIRMSNTLLLESKYKWTGICIEGNPQIYKELALNRKAVCILQCINGVEGEIVFQDREGRSGIVLGESEVASLPANTGLGEIRMNAVPLQKILNEYNSPKTIDYLSIDVEGSEESILTSFLSSEYICRTMTVERPSRALKAHMKMHGYLLVREIPNFDCFFIHKTFTKEYKKNLFEFYRSKRLKSALR